MSSNNLTIGIDLGDRRHAVCVLSAAGDIFVETEVINTREALPSSRRSIPERPSGWRLVALMRDV